jgi:uncharacterized protein (DUF697 family)
VQVQAAGAPLGSATTINFNTNLNATIAGGIATVNASTATTYSRTISSVTTSVLADNATGNNSMTGFKGYSLYKITVTAACWVRIYTDVAARTADASRVLPSPAPAYGGVITEITTAGAETKLLSPAVFGFSNEAPPTTLIPIALTNVSGGSTAITVTITLLQIET